MFLTFCNALSLYVLQNVRNMHKKDKAISTLGKVTKGVTKDCEYGPEFGMILG